MTFKNINRTLLLLLLISFPGILFAQGMPEQIRGLHKILENLYNEMLPMCGNLIGVGQALAGFAALFYIGVRVWRHIAAAEPIDFFPLFRPFVLGFCILNFQSVIGIMNGVLSPTVQGTSSMLNNTNRSIEKLMEQREKERKESMAYKMYGVNDGAGDRDIWMQYTHSDKVNNEGILGSVGYDIEFAVSKAYYNFKSMFKDFISFLLQLLYEAAALCINTIRTFKLLVLAILGPIVLGLAVFDGFQHTLPVYLGRYINIYLWLPIANILGSLLGKIQEEMIRLDTAQIQQTGDSFFSTADIGYIVFMIIGIVCYFTIPSIANMVVNAGGGNPITAKTTSLFGGIATGTVAATAAVTGGGVGMVADAMGNANLMMSQGMSKSGTNSGYFRDKVDDKK
ncbi:conjugative transposon protein TraJ [Niabella beijingensis]|uniref:conjugative transposon protein TraJ n=1 Tax=Niabella beijingensis TaxID=2872700 RepID=UPI001CBC5833|nr:conjugative transposon protein TraJ [Niabella beijingensis]MBZ4188935.1 conjugative transposon protein TraJ [Niabella beijingensis]